MFFDGKAEALKLDEQILEEIKGVNVQGKLGVVLVGDNPASQKYVSLKTSVCEKLGIDHEVLRISERIASQEISMITHGFLCREDIKSVIVQLPLPKAELYPLLEQIPLEKDVDVLSSKARALSFEGSLEWESPVVRAFKHFVQFANIEFETTKVAVVGQGFLVGLPIINWLQREGANVEAFDENSSVDSLRDFDLIVLATGIKNLVQGQKLREKACVVDFGYPGDLDLKSDLSHLRLVSPAIGGVGPLVIRYLIMNHLGI